MKNIKNLEKIVAPVLVIIALIFVASSFKTLNKKKSKAAPAAVKSIGRSEPLEAFDLRMPEKSLKAFASGSELENLSWGRDPFKLDKSQLFKNGRNDTDKDSMQRAFQSLKLSGIFFSQEDPSESIAVVNGEALRKGDRISGFVIREITKNYVVLVNNNEEFQLPLWEDPQEKDQRQGI